MAPAPATVLERLQPSAVLPQRTTTAKAYFFAGSRQSIQKKMAKTTRMQNAAGSRQSIQKKMAKVTRMQNPAQPALKRSMSWSRDSPPPPPPPPIELSLHVRAVNQQKSINVYVDFIYVHDYVENCYTCVRYMNFCVVLLTCVRLNRTE